MSGILEFVEETPLSCQRSELNSIVEQYKYSISELESIVRNDKLKNRCTILWNPVHWKL